MPPVRMAMSCSISLAAVAEAGALTHTTFRVPRRRLTIRVDRASPSHVLRDDQQLASTWTTCSSTGSSSWILEIFLSVIRMRASSRLASIFSVSVTIGVM